MEWRTVASIVMAAMAKEDLEIIRNDLELLGFELLDDKRQQLIERIKTEIIELIHHAKAFERRENLSDYLAQTLQKTIQV